jgi:ribosomal-protein-alanine N-acetyltransferase
MEPIKPIRVRPAVAGDLSRLMQIASRSATAAQWSEDHYQQLFSPNRLALVIEENPNADSREVAGFIVARCAGDEWEIENIAVSGPARRRGLGSRLLGECLQQVRDRGGAAVFLEVRESNHAARALYEKWAFIKSGRRKYYYQDPVEDALILKLYFSDPA